MSASPRRRKLLAQIHMGAAQLGMSDADRHAMQHQLVGQVSASAMTDAQLARVVQHLRKCGARVIATAPVDNDNPDGATRWQLATIERMALDMGWTDGLKDARLRGFLRHTARAEQALWLTRTQASNVITALTRWTNSRKHTP